MIFQTGWGLEDFHCITTSRERSLAQAASLERSQTAKAQETWGAVAPGLPWRTRFSFLFLFLFSGSSPAQALPPLFKQTMNFKSFEFEYRVTHKIPVENLHLFTGLTVPVYKC